MDYVGCGWSQLTTAHSDQSFTVHTVYVMRQKLPNYCKDLEHFFRVENQVPYGKAGGIFDMRATADGHVMLMFLKANTVYNREDYIECRNRMRVALAAVKAMIRKRYGIGPHNYNTFTLQKGA